MNRESDQPADTTDGDRRGLSTRTAFVRIVALVGFVGYLLILVLANLFYGFTGTLERLLFMSVGHLLLAPLAFIASMRLGVLVTIALLVAALVLVLDIAQLIVRAFRAEQTLEYVVLIAANVVLAAISALYIAALGRLRQADNELNNVVTDSDPKEKRAAMIRQESNALRTIAVFDLIAVAVLTVTLLVFGSFSISPQAWTLFYLGHLVVAGLALFGAPRGGIWVPIFLFVVLVQTALDLLQLTLRLLNQPGAALDIFSLDNIISTTLLAISAIYLIVDVAYITTCFGLIAANNTSVDNTTETTESQTFSKASPAAPSSSVRQRTAASIKQQRH